MNIETMRDFLNAVINETDNQDLKNYAEAEIEKINLRNERRKSQQTETQKENEILKDRIVEYMKNSDANQFLAGNISSEFGISTQKASAMLRQLTQDEILLSNNVRVDTDGSIKDAEATTGRPRKAYEIA